MGKLTPAEAQAYCTKVTKRSGSNFYYSFLFLPRARREAMYAVYTFCRELDSTVDDAAPGSSPLEQLALWRNEVTAMYQGTPTFPVTISLAHHAHQLAIPQSYFEELINGVEMDLTIQRYATFDDLYPYCYRVASIVGLICLDVFGTRAIQAKDYATSLGIAFQLTNILRDLAQDADRNRIYLPQEDLLRFGYHEEDLLQHQYSPSFFELMKFECARARDYYRSAHHVLESLPQSDRQSLLAAEIMSGVYSRILDQIEAQRYRVFDFRISLSKSSRLTIAIGIWIRSYFWHRFTRQR